MEKEKEKVFPIILPNGKVMLTTDLRLALDEKLRLEREIRELQGYLQVLKEYLEGES